LSEFFQATAQDAVGAFLNWFTVWEVGKDKRLVLAIQNKNSVAGEAYF